MRLVPTHRVANIQSIFCEIKTVTGSEVGDTHIGGFIQKYRFLNTKLQ